jgi:transposase
MLAALGARGLSAPMTIEGPVDAEVFCTYLRKVLGPTLRKGDMVVMDNLSAHKVNGVAEAIRARRTHLEYLPPYSPDFTPLESCWSKVKTALRKTKARTRQALDRAIAQALGTITAADAPAWFAHCGYPIH